MFYTGSDPDVNDFLSSLLSVFLHYSQLVTPRTNVACICCDEASSKLLSRCLNCEGFLCEKGMETHKTMKFLRSHQVISLEDLQSGKVNLSSLLAKKPTCDDHEGQPLWFYCETCGVLVCQACTVVNHKNPDHVYVELKSAIREQKMEIRQLVEKSSKTSIKINYTLQQTTSTRDNLAANAKKAASDIDNAVQSVIDHVRKLGKAEKDKLDKWVAGSQSKLRVTEEKLLSQQAQLKRAQEMASQVLNTGSDYDVASVYQQLKTSLEETGSVELSTPESGQDHVVFAANLAPSSIQSLGTLTLGVKKVSSRKWVLEKEIGKKSQNASGLAITPSGDIAIANCDPSTPVQIYDRDGLFKFSLDKRSSDARNVVALNDSKLFVTTRDNNACVTVYNSEGQYLSEFPAVSPDGVKSSDEETVLRGLAVNRQNQLLVGEIIHKYISIHDCEGNHVSSINAPVKPSFLSTTRQNNIVVSSRTFFPGSVYVLGTTGNQLVEIKAPQGVKNWTPYGVCVSHNDEICIANYVDNCIHCFSVTGKYLGCLYKGLKSPEGMTFMDNDNRLLVAEWDTDHSTVKILGAKKEHW